MAAARFIVTGKVQGVFFRASTREQARKLGLRGRARNLDDGSVEVVVEGDVVAIDQLDAWLKHGPPLARVECVLRDEADIDEAAVDFVID